MSNHFCSSVGCCRRQRRARPTGGQWVPGGSFISAVNIVINIIHVKIELEGLCGCLCDIRAYLETKDHLENLGNQVTW